MNKILKYYRNNVLLRWFWWLVIVIPAIPFILFSIGFQLYAHWPSNYNDITSKVVIDNTTEYLSLSAHGVKDNTQSWSDKLQLLIKESDNKQLNQYAKAQISLDWQPYSNNALACSVTGRNIGQKLANKIARMQSLKAVHLIGHSCGSFVIYGLCEKLKQLKSAIQIQTTYLDPVAIYSGVFWHYGVNNFGNCADFSDSYIDTEDTVPGSNENLTNAYTFDVTKVRLDNNLSYSPHAWPTFFYLDAYKQQQVPIYFNYEQNINMNFNKNNLITWRQTKKP